MKAIQQVTANLMFLENGCHSFNYYIRFMTSLFCHFASPPYVMPCKGPLRINDDNDEMHTSRQTNDIISEYD